MTHVILSLTNLSVQLYQSTYRPRKDALAAIEEATDTNQELAAR